MLGVCFQGRCECEPGYGGDDCSLSLYQCLNNCSSHGVCRSGFCSCLPGWEGDDCWYSGTIDRYFSEKGRRYFEYRGCHRVLYLDGEFRIYDLFGEKEDPPIWRFESAPAAGST